MLRRYLIINGVSTALIYAAIWMLVPSGVFSINAMHESFEAYTMESPVLSPLIHRIVTVGAY